MAIWLIRAGSHGEYEQKFIQEDRVYVTWDRLAGSLSQLPDRDALFAVIFQLYPDAKSKRLYNWVSQMWPFASTWRPWGLRWPTVKTSSSPSGSRMRTVLPYDVDGF